MQKTLKKFAHILTLALALLVLISLFTGCSDNSQNFPERPSYDTEYRNDLFNDTSNDDESNMHSIDGAECEVVRVVDGDTFIVKFKGENVRIRLSCIDTPESVTNTNRDCEEGRTASAFVKRLLTVGSIVKIETDTKLFDGNDRVLAYVYLEDGTMLNRLLLEMGYAKVYNDKTNHKYTSEFFEIQDNARDEGIGFWPTNPWKKK